MTICTYQFTFKHFFSQRRGRMKGHLWYTMNLFELRQMVKIHDIWRIFDFTVNTRMTFGQVHEFSKVFKPLFDWLHSAVFCTSFAIRRGSVSPWMYSAFRADLGFEVHIIRPSVSIGAFLGKMYESHPRSISFRFGTLPPPTPPSNLAKLLGSALARFLQGIDIVIAIGVPYNSNMLAWCLQ